MAGYSSGPRHKGPYKRTNPYSMLLQKFVQPSSKRLVTVAPEKLPVDIDLYSACPIIRTRSLRKRNFSCENDRILLPA